MGGDPAMAMLPVVGMGVAFVAVIVMVAGWAWATVTPAVAGRRAMAMEQDPVRVPLGMRARSSGPEVQAASADPWVALVLEVAIDTFWRMTTSPNPVDQVTVAAVAVRP